MLQLIKDENGSTEIVELIRHIIDEESTLKGDRYFVNPVWRDLVKVFASPYPLCSFIPPSIDFFNFMNQTFLEGENPVQNDIALCKLQQTIPVIFKLLKSLKEKFPIKKFGDCLPDFQGKVFDPFLKEKCPSENPDDDDSLCYFPALPKVRKRGLFVADSKGSKTMEEFCKKFAKGHPSLLPGVFTLFCEHGKIFT